MLRWIARFFLLRFLPRRLVPLLTVVEVLQLARGLKRRRDAARARDASQLTLPPPSGPPIPTTQPPTDRPQP
jgi:hypothetical protein